MQYLRAGRKSLRVQDPENHCSALKLLAEEDGGLGIVIVAGTGLVSGGEIEADGGVEIVLGVEIEPLGSFAACVFFGGLHEGVGEAEVSEGGADVEALDLGGAGDLRQGAEHDASGGSGVDRGDEDG